MRKSFPSGPVEGERPHVIGTVEIDELGGLVSFDFDDASVGDGAAEHGFVEAGDERRHRELSRFGERRDLPVVDAQDLAGVSRADEDTSVGLHDGAPDRRRLAERQRAEFEARPNVPERVDRRPFQIAARQLVERVELEGACADGLRSRSEGEKDRKREGGKSRSRFHGERVSREILATEELNEARGECAP
jgi:hypothetical protein